MRLPGQGVRHRRLTASGGGRLLVPGEPTLEGARAGQVGEVGVLRAQLEQQVGCAPRGMLSVQQQRLLDRLRRRRGRGRAITGSHGSGPLGAEAKA
jgi:hypothetical protein